MIFEGHVMKKRWKEPAMDGHRRNGEAGFTLMELLIVMAVILILMLVAIPSMLNVTIQAHETSALASLRAIQAAEVQYSSNFPANGFACSLGALGGSSGAGRADATGGPDAAVDAGDGAEGRLHLQRYELHQDDRLEQSGYVHLV